MLEQSSLIKAVTGEKTPRLSYSSSPTTDFSPHHLNWPAIIGDGFVGRIGTRGGKRVGLPGEGSGQTREGAREVDTSLNIQKM